jgi:hypothetical protein
MPEKTHIADSGAGEAIRNELGAAFGTLSQRSNSDSGR